MEKKLSKIYFDVRHPASYSTVEKLWFATGKKFEKSKIEEWLSAQEPYTLHKPRKLKFSRSRYFVPDMNNLFQVDLCDMRTLYSHNKPYNFILTVIDVFCKKAWAVALKDKSAQTVIKAFQKVFSDRKPRYIQSDKGKEFVAKKVQAYFKSLNIKFYTTNNPDTKASVVERFNRTLKTKMWKYFSHASTYKYTDILQDLIDSYNNTIHSAINMTPNEVNEENRRKVFDYLYSGRGRYKLGHSTTPSFSVGQHVRITREKAVFEKGYESNWSREIFKIVKVLKTTPARYVITDLKDEVIEGSFYAQELQKVSLNETYKIDKILDEKGKGRSRQLFVKWLGYPNKFNSWIKASDLQQ